MADTDVHKKVLADLEGQEVLGWIVKYEAGKDQGDHYIAGFTPPDLRSRYGPTFGEWMQDAKGVGGGNHTFSIA